MAWHLVETETSLPGRTNPIILKFNLGPDDPSKQPQLNGPTTSTNRRPKTNFLSPDRLAASSWPLRS